MLQSAIEAEALAPTDGETPVADATPQEPEPEDVSVCPCSLVLQCFFCRLFAGALFAGVSAGLRSSRFDLSDTHHMNRLTHFVRTELRFI